MKRCAGWLLLCVCATGCMESLEKQAEKDPNSIIGKKTQNIGEYKPEAGAVVSDGKIRATDPITAPLSAYGPMVERISKTQIEQAVNLYQAENGEYPKSLEEFMDKIIIPNKIELPVLPGGLQYQYDVPNHKLVVVDAPAAPMP